MLELNEKISLEDLQSKSENFFPDMIKAVIDIEKDIIIVDASMHADLESFLLEKGSGQKNLYGYNIFYNGEIVFESLINIPRNRDDGFPRGGIIIQSELVKDKIVETTKKWVNITIS